jgi:hypothetical protein
MPHLMCRECHRLVSDTAIACPHCGIARPASSTDPVARLRPYGSALLAGVALAWLGGLWIRSQVEQLVGPSGPAPSVIATQDPYPGFQPLRGVWINAPLFNRNPDPTYAGRITSLSCPYQPANATRVACVQIEFADGTRRWVQRSGVESRFLTPKR